MNGFRNTFLVFAAVTVALGASLGGCGATGAAGAGSASGGSTEPEPKAEREAGNAVAGQAEGAVAAARKGGFSPTADAGNDQIVTDRNNDGTERITLDGRASADPDGEIVAYFWSADGTSLGEGPLTDVSLPVGIHHVELTVVDDSGAAADDRIVVTVAPAFDGMPAPETVVLDPEAMRVLAVGDGTMTLQPLSKDDSDVRQGDIVAGMAPDGMPFLRRVTSTDIDPDGFVTLETVPATLADALMDGTVSISGHRLVAELADGEQQLVAGRTVTIIDDEDLKVVGTLTANFEPEIDLDIDIRNKEFRLVAAGSLDTEVGFQMIAKRAFERTVEKQIGDKIEFPPIVFAITTPSGIPIPVVICPTLQFFVGVTGSVNEPGNLDFSGGTFLSATAGVECEGLNCAGISDATAFIKTPSIDYTIPEEVSLEGYAKAVLSFDLYCVNAAELDLTVRPYVELRAEFDSYDGFAITADPTPGTEPEFPSDDFCTPGVGQDRIRFDMYVGLDALIGGRFKPFGVTLFDDEVELPFDLEARVASGTYCFRSLSGVDRVLALLDGIFKANAGLRVLSAQDAKAGLALQAMDGLLGDDVPAAVGALEALVQTANEQRGDQLPESEADELIAEATDLIAFLEEE